MERYEMTTETSHYGLDGKAIQFIEATVSQYGEWVRWDDAEECIRELEEKNNVLQQQLDAMQEKADELKNSLHDIMYIVRQHI